MMNWGDGLWENIAILHETAGLPIEPEPLEREIQEERDLEDQLVITHEDPPSHLRG